MRNEFEKQMSEMLNGSRPTTTTKAIKIFAMDIDKKFANVDEKLDSILDHLKEIRITTDKRIDNIMIGCTAHKIELNKKFEALDNNMETINYFQKHPNILKFVGVALLIVIGYVIGNADSIDLTKLIK
jgi:hypothetical protein